jgi:hypothetical protein
VYTEWTTGRYFVHAQVTHPAAGGNATVLPVFASARCLSPITHSGVGQAQLITEISIALARVVRWGRWKPSMWKIVMRYRLSPFRTSATNTPTVPS